MIDQEVKTSVKKVEIDGKTWEIPYQKYKGANIIDWNSPLWEEKKEGIVIISAKDSGRFIGVTLKPFNDVSGIRIGWHTGTYDENVGQPILGNYRITAFTTVLDLTNINDRKLYIFITRNPMISGGVNTNEKDEVNAMLIVDNREKSASEKSRIRRVKMDALGFLDNASDDEVAGLARLSGLYMENEPILVTREKMESYVEGNPVSFMELKDSKDRAYMIALADGEHYGLVTFNPRQGYLYHGINLGMRKDDVIIELKKNNEVYKTLAREIDDLKNPPSEITIEKSTKVETNDSGDEIARLKAQLKKEQEEKDALLEKLKSSDENPEIEEKETKVGRVIVDEDDDLDKVTSFKKLQSIAVKRELPNDDWQGFKTADELRSYLKSKEKKKAISMM